MHLLPLALLVTVRLYDSFGLTPGELRSATLTADAALHSGSVRAAWVVCPTAPAQDDNTMGCTGVPNAGELLVRIVKAPAQTSSAETLGFASVDLEVHHGTLATIFADRAARLAADAQVEPSTVLGYAIAHELGHLLLGTATHARSGLMRSSWTTDEIRRHYRVDWVFSPADRSALISAAETASSLMHQRERPPFADRSVGAHRPMVMVDRGK
jgi:hypothetical protein